MSSCGFGGAPCSRRLPPLHRVCERESPPGPHSHCPKLMRTERIAARVRVPGSGRLASRGPTCLQWAPPKLPSPPVSSVHVHRAHVRASVGLGGRQSANWERNRDASQSWDGIPVEKMGRRITFLTSIRSSPTSPHFPSSCFTVPLPSRFRKLFGAGAWGWAGGEGEGGVGTGKQPSEICT